MKNNRKLNIKDIFNKNSIAVFVDASVNNENKTTCSGAVIVDENFDTKYTDTVLSNSTNSSGELMAIKLGIEEGLKTERQTINIFSDSLTSVRSLREWIFSWERKGRHKKKLINSNRETVANSNIIMDIVELIVKNNHVKINIFHQKGHIGGNGQNYSKIKRLFNTTNGFIIDDNFVDIMKTYNDMVDYCTRNNLNIAPTVGRTFTPHEPLVFKIDSEVIQKYRSLASIKISGNQIQNTKPNHTFRAKPFKINKFKKR